MKISDYIKWRPKFSKYLITYSPVSPIPDHILRTGHHRKQAAIVGIAAEAGELLGVLQKANRKGEPIPQDRALDELSDVRWYYQMMLDEFGWTDEEVMEYNYGKLEDRNNPERVYALVEAK